MSDNQGTLKELRLILKVLILSNSGAIEKELSKIATTNERKKMWVLIDGKNMPKDIATKAGVTQMAVSNFLNACRTAEFIEYAKGEPPKRTLNYVPPEWISLVKVPSAELPEEKKNAEPNTIQKTMGENQ